EAVEVAQEALRPRDLEDGKAAARAEHPPQLAQPSPEVFDVADAEADRRGVELAVREREREQIALDPVDRRRLPARPLEHPRGEVQPGHPPTGPLRRKREVAGAAAGV